MIIINPVLIPLLDTGLIRLKGLGRNPPWSNMVWELRMLSTGCELSPLATGIATRRSQMYVTLELKKSIGAYHLNSNLNAIS